MDFVALVDQVIALLRQRGRVTYRTLQRQFQLDAETLEDLLGELRYTCQEALREDEQGLIWTDEAHPAPPTPVRPAAKRRLAPWYTAAGNLGRSDIEICPLSGPRPAGALGESRRDLQTPQQAGKSADRGRACAG